jgi:antitoxin component of MazEF toxin-antitoxin module/uncharacterized protein YegP (UPF0339 family)
MLTVISNTENPNAVAIPADEMERLGIKNGDEVELSKENDEIIMRSTAEVERKRKFEDAKEKIFEEWHDVFVELAKGANDETVNSFESKTNGRFVLSKTRQNNYKFILTTSSGRVIFESRIFESQEEARQAIDFMKKEISEIKDKILDFPVKSELETV